MRVSWARSICEAMVAVVMLAPAATRAAALPDPIDLTSLDEVAAAPAAPVWDDVRVEPVALRTAGEPRFYVTGLLGESFVTLSEPLYGEFFDRRINRSVLTTGGAAGVAFDRGNGLLRVEVEGQGRDDVTAAFRDSVAPFFGADFRWAANDGWSALVNVWRDFTVTEQVDLYLGGGVGAGGYRYGLAGDITIVGVPFVTVASQAQVAAFAWQLGGGAVWNVSDRVALDVGYRFFSIDQADTTLNLAAFGVPAASMGLMQQYTASELLFGLRIYEPFRNWH